MSVCVCVCVHLFVVHFREYVGYTFLVECCVVWGHFSTYKVMLDLCVCMPTLANGSLLCMHATVEIVNEHSLSSIYILPLFVSSSRMLALALGSVIL